MQYAKTVNFSDSGLSTVGYVLYDVDGSVYQARTTADVVELGSSGVYFVKMTIPDDFNGVILWDDGQTDTLYASEDLAGFQNKKLGDITDSVDVLLQSIAMHRAEVEPAIDKLSVDGIRDSLDAGLQDVKATSSKMKDDIKNSTKEVKQAFETQMKKLDLVEKNKFNNVIDKIENLNSEYKETIKDIKSLSDLKGVGIKKELSKLVVKIDGVSSNIRTVLDGELVAAMSSYIKQSQKSIYENLSKDIDSGLSDVADKITSKTKVDKDQINGIIEKATEKMEKQMVQYLIQMVSLINLNIKKPDVETKPFNKISLLRVSK